VVVLIVCLGGSVKRKLKFSGDGVFTGLVVVCRLCIVYKK